MLKLTKTEVLFDTEYQEYSDLEGNVLVLEDGVIKMVNESVLDSHGNMIPEFNELQSTIVKLITKEIGNFDTVKGDKEKYMELVMDFVYENIVDDLTGDF